MVKVNVNVQKNSECLREPEKDGHRGKKKSHMSNCSKAAAKPNIQIQPPTQPLPDVSGGEE